MPRPLTCTLLSVAVLIFVAGGCTPKTPPGTVMHSPEAAWNSFRRHYCARPDGPALKVKASLHYSQVKPRKRTNRTLMTMWGDFKGTMRMDVSASIGTLLAHIRENDEGLLVFYPADNQAYAHVDPVLGATRLGMPFPFSLSDLGHVLLGDFSGLVPKRYAGGSRTARGTGGFVYTFDDGLVTSVTLDVVGRPVLVEGRAAGGSGDAKTWRLEVNRYETPVGDEVPLGDRLTLALDNGEKGVLHIKSRELMLAAWPGEALALELPDDVDPIRLDAGDVDRETGEIPVIYEENNGQPAAKRLGYGHFSAWSEDLACGSEMADPDPAREVRDIQA